MPQKKSHFVATCNTSAEINSHPTTGPLPLETTQVDACYR